MALRDVAHHVMLDHFASVATRASLHSGFPCTALNELSGGTPAYARKAITWNPAASRNLDNDVNPVFDVPPGSTVAGFAIWNTDGSIMWGDNPLPEEDFAGQGQYTLTDADIVSANL